MKKERGGIYRMMKQYGIDPELVLWIQRSAGRDLQTFSDLARIKCLDNTRRNYGAAKKIDEVRLPSWLVVRDGEISLIGEMTKLKQLILHDIEEAWQDGLFGNDR